MDMKTIRLFSMFVALLMGSALYAQNDTTAVRIKLYATGTTQNKILTILQNAAFDANKKESDEGTIQMGEEPKNVNVWAIAPYGDMSTLKTNNIVGTKLGFRTNNSNTEYELCFDQFMGDVLYLKDNETGVEFPCTATYFFTAEAGKKTITDRFVFVTPTSPISPEYEICYRNGYLQISNYPTDKNTDHIVIKDADGKVIKDEAPKAIYHEIDLRRLTKGHYTIEANGEVLTIGVQ